MCYPKLTWTLPDRGWKTSFQSKWVMFRGSNCDFFQRVFASNKKEWGSCKLSLKDLKAIHRPYEYYKSH